MSTKKRSVWLVTLTILAALLIAPTFRPAVQSTTPVVVSVPLKADSPGAIESYPLLSGFCFPDVDGANDVAGQKDLTRLCLDTTTNSSVIEVEWDWDPTGTSGANTMNALVFFDTDADGFANYALNVTTHNDPATLVGIEWYSCVSDNSATQCGGATLLATPAGISCEIHSPVATDPFAAGQDYPNDAVGFCHFPRASLPVLSSSVLNVCTIPSDVIDSVRSDCTAFAGGGFITIEKYENPPAGITWDFLVNNGSANVCLPGPTITPDTTTGYGAKLCSLQPATYSVVESDYNTNSPYSLVAWGCTNTVGGAAVGTSNGTNGTTGLVIASGTNYSCEFDNATPTAVTIGSFTADAASEGVELSWASLNETDVLGYNIFRSIVPGVTGTQVNATQIPALYKGTLGGPYTFVDSSPVPGLTNYYQILVVHTEYVEWSDGATAFVFGFARFLPYVIR
jgi:hypothetical protein